MTSETLYHELTLDRRRLGWQKRKMVKAKYPTPQFNIIENEPHQVVADWIVPTDWPTFQGHFPGDPILPAVSIIDISCELLMQSQAITNLSQLNLKRSKFMSFVRPGQQVMLTIEPQGDKDWVILWKLASNQSKLAQVHLAF